MNPLVLTDLARRAWPAFAGVCGAVYFLSTGDPAHAVNALLVGLGLGQVLHSVTKPTGAEA